MLKTPAAAGVFQTVAEGVRPFAARFYIIILSAKTPGESERLFSYYNNYANRYRYSASGVSKYSGQFSCRNCRISGTSYAQPAAANGTFRVFAMS